MTQETQETLKAQVRTLKQSQLNYRHTTKPALKKQIRTLKVLKNYFLQCGTTAAGSSQSNVSRIYILNNQ